jgi:hypothetical protein
METGIFEYAKVEIPPEQHKVACHKPESWQEIGFHWKWVEQTSLYLIKYKVDKEYDSIAAGCRVLVPGCLFLVACSWLLVPGCLFLAIGAATF